MTKSDPLSLVKKTQYRVPFGTISLTEEAKALINSVLVTKRLTKDKMVREFEEKFAHSFGVKEAVAVSSGTDAVAIACAVLYDYGAQRGDEIIVPALSFVASGNAVLQAGFKPVFVDIEKETLNINVKLIEKALTPKTKAILAVHLMGKPAAMGEIEKIAKKHKLYIIEDAAEAHGAEYNGKRIGGIGHLGAFSLYAAHIVTTVEGGIITTNDPKMAEAARSLRNHGITGKFTFERIGFSAKMNELEACVGLGNLQIFDDILGKRRKNLLYLINKFQAFERYFLTLKEEAHEKIGPHAFSILLEPDCPFTKDEFVAFLDKSGIDSRNLFYSIPTQCRAYAFLGKKLGDFPEAEYVSDHGTHIGIHQDLGQGELDHVVTKVGEFLKNKR